MCQCTVGALTIALKAVVVVVIMVEAVVGEDGGGGGGAGEDRGRGRESASLAFVTVHTDSNLNGRTKRKQWLCEPLHEHATVCVKVTPVAWCSMSLSSNKSSSCECLHCEVHKRRSVRMCDYRITKNNGDDKV